MNPTPQQMEAIKLAKAWYLSGDRKKRPFVFTGFAGTGKSSSIKWIIDSLGLDNDEVKYVAFTGMAASVLSKKGNPATTIHKLIYDATPTSGGGVRFELKESLPSNLKLLVVDEFSTVGKDLMDDLESFGIPLLLAGDPGWV